MSNTGIPIPPVPQSVDPELRVFLQAVRSHLLALDGQTRVSRQDDDVAITKRGLRDILPGLVDMLLKEKGLI